MTLLIKDQRWSGDSVEPVVPRMERDRRYRCDVQRPRRVPTVITETVASPL
jgi:hypothetical protein